GPHRRLTVRKVAPPAEPRPDATPSPGSPSEKPLVVALCSTVSSAAGGTTGDGDCRGAPAANAVPSTRPATERAPTATYRARRVRRAVPGRPGRVPAGERESD